MLLTTVAAISNLSIRAECEPVRAECEPASSWPRAPETAMPYTKAEPLRGVGDQIRPWTRGSANLRHYDYVGKLLTLLPQKFVVPMFDPVRCSRTLVRARRRQLIPAPLSGRQPRPAGWPKSWGCVRNPRYIRREIYPHGLSVLHAEMRRTDKSWD